MFVKLTPELCDLTRMKNFSLEFVNRSIFLAREEASLGIVFPCAFAVFIYMKRNSLGRSWKEELY